MRKPGRAVSPQESTGSSLLQNVLRIASILLWALVLFTFWHWVFPEAEGALSAAKWVIGFLLAPFWGGLGSSLGEKIEQRLKPESSNPAADRGDPRLVGVKGWLIVPAIYLLLGATNSGLRVILSFVQFSAGASAGYPELHALSILVELGFLVFLLYAATRFFRKKRNAPSAMIGVMIAGVVVNAILQMIDVGAGAQEFAVEPLLGHIISAVIWISYFRVSRRVRATFLN